MVISLEKRFEVLYDHYKDSFLYLREYLKQRERLFVFVLIIVFFHFLLISFSDQYLEALKSFVEKQVDFNLPLGREVIGSFLWFLLFAISLRYFQVNILINRQYSYLHSLEDRLSSKYGEKDFIRREGQRYLKNYPLFSDWVNIIYTWVFPIFLILIVIIRIVFEFIKESGDYSLSLFIDGGFSILICISTILYLANIHFKK